MIVTIYTPIKNFSSNHGSSIHPLCFRAHWWHKLRVPVCDICEIQWVHSSRPHWNSAAKCIECDICSL